MSWVLALQIALLILVLTMAISWCISHYFTEKRETESFCHSLSVEKEQILKEMSKDDRS